MDPSTFLGSVWGMIWRGGLSTFSDSVWIHRDCFYPETPGISTANYCWTQAEGEANGQQLRKSPHRR